MQDTPQRLLDAAERLLAERDEARISLRDITEAAGANVASVNYHFGSKDALLAQTVRRALGEVTERQRAQLAALPEDADLEQLVRTWLAPALESLTEPDEQLRRRSRLLNRALAAPSPAISAQLGETAAVVEEHLLRRIHRHVPHLGNAELRFRHVAVLGAIGGLASGGLGRLLEAEEPRVVADRMVAWIVGGLTAPAADHGPGKEQESGNAL